MAWDFGLNRRAKSQTKNTRPNFISAILYTDTEAKSKTTIQART
jgi:hypothetical protein